MEDVKELLCTLEEIIEVKRVEIINDEKTRDIEYKKIEDFSRIRKDQYKQSIDEIHENLKTIKSYKHIIHKAQNSVCNQNNTLPLSNIHHGLMIDFIGASVVFINVFCNEDMTKPSMHDSDIADVMKGIQLFNENFAKLVHKENVTVDDLSSALVHLHILTTKLQELIRVNEHVDTSLVDYNRSYLH